MHKYCKHTLMLLNYKAQFLLIDKIFLQQCSYPKEQLMPGLIIYAGNECDPVDDNIIAMPWNAVFE